MDGPDQKAFDLGWDFAVFGLNVPEDANKAFCDGYRAFRAGNTKTTHVPDRYVRKWLQIRYGAFRRGKRFARDVTPQYIEQITPASGRCPVTDVPFTYAEDKPTDWSVDRANNARGYVRGNILIISRAANEAKGDKSLDEIRALAAAERPRDGLTPAEWERLGQLVEPAFGDGADDVSPVPILVGQPVALGMPVSPLASLQLRLAQMAIAGWDRAKRDEMSEGMGQMQLFVCRTKEQRRAFVRLAREVLRRSKTMCSNTELWATDRVQKRFGSFVASLDSAGLSRLAELQANVTGVQNTKLSQAPGRVARTGT
jgi:hypothetical protein